MLMGVVGKEKVRDAIEKARSADGDAYTKAAILLVSLVQGHPFESGNRRTAYAVAVNFIESNGLPVAATFDLAVIKGIRGGTHKSEQVAVWLKGHGK